MKVRLHSLAESEIREAAAWYACRGEELGRRFLASVAETLESLEADPQRFTKLETLAPGSSIRRALLSSFPYLVVFEPFEDEVFVYAVAHASQRPNYWHRRKRVGS